MLIPAHIHNPTSVISKRILVPRTLTYLPSWVASTPFYVGAFWFLLSMVVMLSMWGMDPDIFITPDEANNHRAATLLHESGSASYTQDINDSQDLIHQRFWISDGNTVLLSYPPFTYFVQALLMGVPLIGGLLIMMIPAIGIACIASSIALLGKNRQWLSIMAPAVAYPVLFWLLRPWMNMSYFLAFVAIALLLGAIWKSSSNNKHLYLAFLMLIAAALTRPDYIHLVFGVGVLLSLAFAPRSHSKKIVITGAAAGLIAVLGLAILNAMTTGSPTTFAYQKVEAVEEQTIDSLPLQLDKVAFLLFPHGIRPISEYGELLYKYWITMPGMGLFMAGMVFTAFKGGYPSDRRQLYLLIGTYVFLAFFVITRVTIDRSGAEQPIADISHGLPRIWSVAYLLLILPLFMLAMSSGPWWIALRTGLQTRKANILRFTLTVIPRREFWSYFRMDLSRTVGVAAIVLTGFYGLYIVAFGPGESLQRMSSMIADWEETVPRWTIDTPEDAVVYSTHLDKILWSHRTVAVLPGKVTRSDEEFDKVALSITDVVAAGRPVSVIRTNWSESDIAQVNERLSSRGLVLIPTGPRSSDPWHLETRPVELVLENTGVDRYTATLPINSTSQRLVVLNDGSTSNLVENPSFEESLAGWGGPDYGEFLRLVDTDSVAGDSSLRMELPANGLTQDNVRTSYLLDIKDVDFDTWTLRTKVQVQELDGAEVVLKGHVQDSGGKFIQLNRVTTGTVTDGYVDLSVSADEIPDGAAKLLIQLSVEPTEESGSGVVLWDAVQLTPGLWPASEYCDGDQNGCSWAGASHDSASFRTGDISTITVFAEDGGVIDRLPWSQIEAGDGVIELSELRPGSEATVSIESRYMPRIATEN